MINDLLQGFSIFFSGGLFLHELTHGLVGLPFAFFLYKKTRRIKYFLLTMATLYLIDLDHSVDYLLYHGFRISLVDIFKFEYFINTQRATVPLHAWEWVTILGFLVYREKEFKSFKAVYLFSLIPHLIYDSYTTGSVVFYSIIYRITTGFFI